MRLVIGERLREGGGPSESTSKIGERLPLTRRAKRADVYVGERLREGGDPGRRHKIGERLGGPSEPTSISASASAKARPARADVLIGERLREGGRAKRADV